MPFDAFSHHSGKKNQSTSTFKLKATKSQYTHFKINKYKKSIEKCTTQVFFKRLQYESISIYHIHSTKTNQIKRQRATAVSIFHKMLAGERMGFWGGWKSPTDFLCARNV